MGGGRPSRMACAKSRATKKSPPPCPAPAAAPSRAFHSWREIALGVVPQGAPGAPLVPAGRPLLALLTRLALVAQPDLVLVPEPAGGLVAALRPLQGVVGAQGGAVAEHVHPDLDQPAGVERAEHQAGVVVGVLGVGVDAGAGAGDGGDAGPGPEELQGRAEGVGAIGAAPLAHLPGGPPGGAPVRVGVEALHVVEVLALGEVALPEQPRAGHGPHQDGLPAVAVVLGHHVAGRARRRTAATRSRHCSRSTAAVTSLRTCTPRSRACTAWGTWRGIGVPSITTSGRAVLQQGLVVPEASCVGHPRPLAESLKGSRVRLAHGADDAAGIGAEALHEPPGPASDEGDTQVSHGRVVPHRRVRWRAGATPCPRGRRRPRRRWAAGSATSRGRPLRGAGCPR